MNDSNQVSRSAASRWLNWKTYTIVLIGLPLAWLLIQVIDFTTRSGPPKPSREMTHVLGPVDDAGYIDYLAAFNQIRREGVEPEQNAAIGILRLLHGEIGNAGAVNISPEFVGELFPEGMSDSELSLQTLDQAYLEFSMANVSKTSPGDERSAATLNAQEQYESVLARRWTRDEFPWAGKWLADNSDALDRLVEELKKPDFFAPLVTTDPTVPPTMFGADLGFSQAMRTLTRSLMARAYNSLAQKDYEGCFEDIEAMHRLGMHLEKNSTVLERLIAIAVMSSAFGVETELVRQAELDSSQWLDFQRRLRPLHLAGDLNTSIDIGERLLVLDAIQSFERGDDMSIVLPGGPFQYLSNAVDWRVARIETNRFIDDVAADTGDKDLSKRSKAFEDLARTLEKKADQVSSPAKVIPKLVLSRYSRSKVANDLLLTHLFPALFQIHSADVRARTYHELSLVGFALEAYRADHGDYPAALQDLVPQYIDTVPIDHFTGGALIYKRRRGDFQVYSLGRNRVDDGGRDYETGNGDDVSLSRVPITADSEQ